MMTQKAWLMAFVMLFSVSTISVIAQSPKGKQGSTSVDPYGNPLPTHEQSRVRLERLLGRIIDDYRPIQREPAGAATTPYDGSDNPVACTQATSVPKPTPDDLAATPDVQFTPEVQSLVARLGADPRALYLYVKNGYVYTPYFGSQKGSRGTELEFAGNDYDQASLLIALLRYAGIPARYVFGTMYIPAARALNWLQVDNPTAAMNILQWQGIPAEFVKDKDRGDVLMIERVWVEAYIDRHGDDRDHAMWDRDRRDDHRKPRWVPMDPAFKQYWIKPASPLATAVSFDQSAYLNLPPTDPRTPYEFLAGNLQSYLNTARPGDTVDNVVRSSSIIRAFLPWNLPGRLENRVKHKTEQSELTDSQRYMIAVSTVDAQGTSAQVTLQLPAIYGQRLTVSFPPATTSDQSLVQASGGYYNAPADQLNVVASINLNGHAVATGSRSVSIGAEHYVVVDMLYPGAAQPSTVFHTVFAGGYYGLGLDVQGDLSEELSRRKDDYLDALSIAPDPTYNDATVGDYLNRSALAYLNNVQAERLNVGAMLSAAQVMDVSEALTMQNITIEYVNGAWQFRPFGWTIDAQRIADREYADNGDDSDFPQIETVDGLGSSLQESRLWDMRTGIQSISTTRGLQLANAMGIPIYKINQGNASTLIPDLNVFSGVLQNVEDEVNAGYTVTIPASTLTMNQWEGSVWIEQSADGSSTGYLIAGGLFGGSTTEDPKNRVNQNPSCQDLNNAIDADAGSWDSDIERAVEYQESGMKQFDWNSGNPVTDEDSNGSVDIGITQVNDNTWAGNPVYPPSGGQPITVGVNELESNWQYNVQVGSYILNTYIQQATTILENMGDANPTSNEIIWQSYYMYNHGSNIPPGYTYQNGNLTPILYMPGDKYTYTTSRGTTRTISITDGVLDAQTSAANVDTWYINKTWLNPNGPRGKTVCSQ